MDSGSKHVWRRGSRHPLLGQFMQQGHVDAYPAHRRGRPFPQIEFISFGGQN
jgi:hypothetical protein